MPANDMSTEVPKGKLSEFSHRGRGPERVLGAQDKTESVGQKIGSKSDDKELREVRAVVKSVGKTTIFAQDAPPMPTLEPSGDDNRPTLRPQGVSLKEWFIDGWERPVDNDGDGILEGSMRVEGTIPSFFSRLFSRSTPPEPEHVAPQPESPQRGSNEEPTPTQRNALSVLRDILRPQTPRTEREEPVEHGPIHDWAELQAEQFGSKGSFGSDFAQNHGLPATVTYENPQTHERQTVDVMETLNIALNSGGTDQAALYRLDAIINMSTDPYFRRSKVAFMSLLTLNANVIGTDTKMEIIAKTLEQSPGLSPKSVADWLAADQDTSMVLGRLFKFAGYTVAGMDGLATLGEITPLADFSNITPSEIKRYIDAAVADVGCDSGVGVLAWTVFRYLGFPHGTKFAELRTKYQMPEKDGLAIGEPSRPETKDKKENKARMFKRKDLAPFIEKLSPAGDERKLKEILAREGMPGFVRAFSQVPEDKIYKAWTNMQLFIDAADEIQDCRDGDGIADNLRYYERKGKILNQNNLKILSAKRAISSESLNEARRVDKIKKTAVRERTDRQRTDDFIRKSGLF